MADAPRARRRRATKVKLDDGAFGARFRGPLVHQSVRAEQAARRRGTAATKTRGDGLRRRRQAVAPEGHRPRPRRLQPLADLDGRRHRRSARSRAPTPSRSTARSSAPRCAARCRCTPSAARSRSSTPAPSTAPKTQPGVRPARRLGPAAARRSSCSRAEESDAALSFRNLARVAVLRGRRRRRRPTCVGAASLLVSEAALDAAHRARRRSRARRRREEAGLMEHTQVIIRPVVSEKSYVLSARRPLHLPRPPRRAQDADPPGGRGAVRRARRRGAHDRASSPSPSAAA